MNFHKKKVELLAPAGTWEAFEAAISAGADAVYLGGKHFNMRLHRKECNFDDALLKKAIVYAHAHGVRLYVTINNLISDAELPELREYLKYLETIQPNALLIQDLALLQLAEELKLTIPLHASIMMNTHNVPAIQKLKAAGVSRVVVSTQMTLSEMALMKKDTGIEIEYFIHGDMCVSANGQCIHSGVVFGQSGNRGRCLKPCRWAYTLIDEATGKRLETPTYGPYKLALKDMCMYRNLPELIQSGVDSFKIEGRMRPADFVYRIVSLYREAIDRYLEDPQGYAIDETAWQKLFANRSRDFTTAFALGQPDADAIGSFGEREPRFFSRAIEENDCTSEVLENAQPISLPNPSERCLSVHVSCLEAAKTALDAGADVLYLGGEAFLPQKPWTLTNLQKASVLAREKQAKIILDTPRIAMRQNCEELKTFFQMAAERIRPDGFLVSHLGMLQLAQEYTDLPIQTDFSFNLFNAEASRFLHKNKVSMGTISLELSFSQAADLVKNSPLPLEIILHGAIESKICHFPLAAMYFDYNPLENPELLQQSFALLDETGGHHPLCLDQYGRTHIFFAKDLCLYPYINKFNGFASYRIEAQRYTPEWTGKLTRFYRQALDTTSAGEKMPAFSSWKKESPRPLSVGAYRFPQSL